jgi:uncharacterized protein with FMN-binding domain
MAIWRGIPCVAAFVLMLAVSSSAVSRPSPPRLDAPFSPPEWLAETKVPFSDADLTATNQYGLTIWSKLDGWEGDSARFREAIATMHRCWELNTNPALKAVCSQRLGLWYEGMMQDYARAYYWFRNVQTLAAEAAQIHDPQNHNMRDTKAYATLAMARCCARMGLAEEARDLVVPFKFRDWRELFDLAVVYRLMRDTAKSDAAILEAMPAAKSQFDRLSAAGRGIILFFANGNVAEVQNRMPQYAELYGQAAGQGGAGLGPNLKGQNSLIEIIRARIAAPQKVNLASLRTGTYEGESAGCHNPIKVSVRLDAGRLADVKVTGIREKRCFNAAAVVSDEIVKKQSLGVDGVSGATVTSLCLANAVRNAFEKAQP